MSNKYPMVPLGEVLVHYQEYIETPEPRTYPKLSVKLYGKGVVLDTPAEGSSLKMQRHQIARSGQVILSEIWGKKGAIGFVPPEGDGALCTSHFFLFDVQDGKIDPKYLQAIFTANYLQDQLDSDAKGTTGYAAVRPKHLLAAKIPLPSLEEQQRVVARIEELAGKIEEARGLRQRVEDEAEQFWESNLATMFGQLAKNHTNKTFREICDVVRGGSPRPAGDPTYYDGSIPFLKVADLTNDSRKFVTNYSSTIKEAGLRHTRYVEPGTLMLTNSGATLGVPKICTFGTCFNDGIQALLGIPEDISKEYLYYFLRSKTYWLREKIARGQGQPNLNTEMVKSMLVPLPPLKEQKRIVVYLDDLQSRIGTLKQVQSETSEELDALLPSILDKAFKGEL